TFRSYTVPPVTVQSLVSLTEPLKQRRRWVMIESRNDTRLSQVGVVGGGIRMNCSVRSSGNVSVKWMLPDGSKLEAPYRSSDNRITASPNGLLVVTAVDHSDSGAYYCIAQVADDVSVLPFHLTVEESSTAPPVGEEVAEPVVGVAGGSVYLPCDASGSPDPDINWIIPNSSIINMRTNLSKMQVASNGTLIIYHSQLSDNGYYKCVAGNQHGADSLATKVTLTRPSGALPLRKYSSRPQPAEGVSTKIKLECQSQGHPHPRTTWVLPDRTVVHADAPTPGRRFLILANGDFLCVARNKIGDDYVPLKVSILTKPAKIEQRTQANQKVMYGSDLKVDCVASGLPNPKIQWALPDGTMVNSVRKTDSSSSSRSRRYVVFDNGTL
uniref:Ig-like domain-containing protein n=1 Tax=Electrophorus electricus TaxID=8005 RepID=A0AAY5EP62_ELEEL